MFALWGQTYSKHSAIRAALHRELVQTGRFETEMGRAYDFLLDLRETGDYGGLTQVSPDSAATAVEKAGAFVEAVGQACPELGQQRGEP